MITLVVFALSTFVVPQDDVARQVREFVQKLRSDQVEERDEASRKIQELGKDALPELEKAARSDDAETRARIKAIVEEIARQERVQAVRPRSLRLTIDFKDLPFPEAVRKVLAPFGVTEVAWAADLEKRPVSLRLEKATLWETVDAFSIAAHAKVESLSGVSRWKFMDAGPAGDPTPKVDTGDIRILAHDCGFTRTDEEPWRNVLSVQVLLPPRFWASSLRMEGGVLADDQGRPIEATGQQGEPAGRQSGFPASAHAWMVGVLPEKFKGAKSLQFTGTVAIRFPHDLERYEIDLRALKVPFSPKIPGVDLTLKECRRTGERLWEMTLNVKGGPARETFLPVVESAEGRWLFDAASFTIAPGESMGEGSNSFIPKGAEAARLVFCRVRGEDEIKIPFVLSKVPLPPPPPAEKK